MAITASHIDGGQPDRSIPYSGADRDELSEDEVARIAKALSHPVRVRLLRQLCEAGSSRAKDLITTFDLAQSTVSEHLRILREAGLVAVACEGSRKWYYARTAVLVTFADHVDGLVRTDLSPESI